MNATSVITPSETKYYVKVACRLCGEIWNMPPVLARQFDSEHGFECSYCRATLRRLNRR